MVNENRKLTIFRDTIVYLTKGAITEDQIIDPAIVLLQLLGRLAEEGLPLNIIEYITKSMFKGSF